MATKPTQQTQKQATTPATPATPATSAPAFLRLAPVGKSVLPQVRSGQIATSANVSIHDNGQILFSALATKTLGTSKVCLTFDQATRTLFVIAATEMYVNYLKSQGATDESIADATVEMQSPKKGGYVMAGSRFLQSPLVFGENGLYDYKNSGNQIFPAATDETWHMVSIQLPVGALPKREITPRPRKPKTETVSAGDTTVNGVNGAAVEQAEPVGDQLELVG